MSSRRIPQCSKLFYAVLIVTLMACAGQPESTPTPTSAVPICHDLRSHVSLPDASDFAINAGRYTDDCYNVVGKVCKRNLQTGWYLVRMEGECSE